MAHTATPVGIPAVDAPVPVGISVADTAIILDGCEKSIRNMIDRGELPAYRVGRALRVPIEAVLEHARTTFESYARLRTVMSCAAQGIDVAPDPAIREAAAAVLGSLPEGGAR